MTNVNVIKGKHVLKTTQISSCVYQMKASDTKYDALPNFLLYAKQIMFQAERGSLE